MKNLIRKIARLMIVAGIVLPLFLVVNSYAISNPTTIGITSVKVFQNVYQTGDMLFVADEHITYSVAPTQASTLTFSMTLLDASSNLLASTPITAYQYGVASIYKSAADVVTLGLVYSSAYKVRIGGNPAYFGTLTEGANMFTTTLAGSDWIIGSQSDSRGFLQTYCLTVATDIQNGNTVTIVATASDGSLVLNTTGRSIFLAAIPGLDSVCPSLFSVSSQTITVTRTGRTRALEGDLAPSNTLGTTLNNAFIGIGAYLNVPGPVAANGFAMIFISIFMAIAYMVTGNTSIILATAMFGLIIFTLIGMLSPVLLFVVISVIVVYLGYQIWLRGT